MIKMLLFVRRKEGLTREQFRDRYESGHVPLAISELPHLVGYARNYVRPAKGQPEPDFDVVTQFWFADREGWKATSKYAMDPVTGRTLAEDEAVFMDRSTMRFLLVEERVADTDAVRAGKPAQNAGTPLCDPARPSSGAKTMLLIRRREGISGEAFRAHYELHHVPLALSLISTMRDYVRNYVEPAKGQPAPDFDVVTECGFVDRVAMKETAERLADPEIHSRIARDEAEFMDTAALRMFVVEQHVADLAAARVSA